MKACFTCVISMCNIVGAYMNILFVLCCLFCCSSVYKPCSHALLPSDCLIVFVCNGDSFGLRVMPSTLIYRVIDSLSTKWCDLTLYTVDLSFVCDGKHNDLSFEYEF